MNADSGMTYPARGLPGLKVSRTYCNLFNEIGINLYFLEFNSPHFICFPAKIWILLMRKIWLNFYETLILLKFFQDIIQLQLLL